MRWSRRRAERRAADEAARLGVRIDGLVMFGETMIGLGVTIGHHRVREALIAAGDTLRAGVPGIVGRGRASEAPSWLGAYFGVGDEYLAWSINNGDATAVPAWKVASFGLETLELNADDELELSGFAESPGLVEKYLVAQATFPALEAGELHEFYATIYTSPHTLISWLVREDTYELVRGDDRRSSGELLEAFYERLGTASGVVGARC